MDDLSQSAPVDGTAPDPSEPEPAPAGETPADGAELPAGGAGLPTSGAGRSAAEAELAAANPQQRERERELAEARAAAIQRAFNPQDLDIEVVREHAIRVPIDEVMALGAGFQTLGQQLAAQRLATSQMADANGMLEQLRAAAENLVELTHKDGTAATISELVEFKDGTGLRAQIVNAKGQIQENLRVNQVGLGDTVDALTENLGDASDLVQQAVAVNPAMMVVAYELVSINQKLDELQRTAEAILTYLQERDMAEVRADLETLSEITKNYAFNWDDDLFKQGKFVLVQDIRNRAGRRIKQVRAQLEREAGDRGPALNRDAARKQAERMQGGLCEYKLALHAYAYSYFLEVVLQENYSHAYLASVIDDLRDRSYGYRTLYSTCYEVIEGRTGKAVDKVVLGSVATAAQGLGRALADTPVGKHSPLDDVLLDAGRAVSKASRKEDQEAVEPLIFAKDVDVPTFIEGLQELDTIYNTPTALLCDGDSIYLLPQDEERD